MYKKITAAALAAAMILTFAACGKNTDKEETSSIEETSSVVVSEIEPDTETEDTADEAAETFDTPDIVQREESTSPYAYPYDPGDLKEDLIDYASSLGMKYDHTLTMQTASSSVKIETRSAVNDAVLETWCKSEIDDIASLAKSSNIALVDVDFNVIVTESSQYDGEYDIAIYGSCR